jgi:hypothetical protein
MICIVVCIMCRELFGALAFGMYCQILWFHPSVDTKISFISSKINQMEWKE